MGGSGQVAKMPGEICGAPMPCPASSASYLACSDATASHCRFLGSDGTSFACNRCTDCTSAAQAVASWCNTTVVVDMSMPPGPTDLPIGSPCSSNTNCRSGYCHNHACDCNKSDRGYACKGAEDCCAPGGCYGGFCLSYAPGCIALGKACMTDSDCCLGLCVNGACACSSPGFPGCTSNRQCCSDVCAINPDDSFVCSSAPTGGHCATGPDCLSLICSGGICQ
jgi:hypothetical protein